MNNLNLMDYNNKVPFYDVFIWSKYENIFVNNLHPIEVEFTISSRRLYEIYLRYTVG